MMDEDDLVLLHCLPMYVYTYVCRRMAIDTLLYYYSTTVLQKAFMNISYISK